MPLADMIVIQDQERLQALKVLCLLDTHPDPAFDRLTELAADLLDVPVALVSLVDADRQFFKSEVGLSEPYKTVRETPLSHSFCQHVVVSAEPLIINDARTHPLLYDNLAIIDLNVIAYVGIPLTMSSGHTIGSLCIIDNKPREWSQHDVDILTKFAASVMTEIELKAEILERQRIEKEREQLLARVTELEQLKSDMIRIAAHDLRAPLSLIVGYTALLDDDALNEVQREFLSEITRATTRMETMIRDILSLERIESRAAGQEDSVNLNTVVQAAFDERYPHAEQKAQYCRLTLPHQTVVIQGDAVQLQEAVENLIGNAIKYTPEHGCVQVRLTEAGCFEVEDTGFGIPENQQKGLFAPFYRAKSQETQNIEGTGLGLHLVKRIIERHRGTMHFHSEYGKGSTFGFQFKS